MCDFFSDFFMMFASWDTRKRWAHRICSQIEHHKDLINESLSWMQYLLEPLAPKQHTLLDKC
jgi:hypothetical protein